MAFPVVQTTNQNSGSAGTSHTISMPSGITVGDLILVFFGTDGDNTITNSQTFTVLDQESNTTASFAAVLYKIAAGSDTLTITTSQPEESSHIVFRIDGWESSFIPELSTVAEDSTANPNSTIVTPSWAQDDTLYVSMFSADRSRTISAYPANYTGNNLYESGGANGSCAVGTATRNYNNPSDDPAQWTISAADQWVAWTIAVAPSGATAPVWNGDSHNWRFYEEGDSIIMTAQNTKPNGVGQTKAFCINWCVHEIGGLGKSNVSLDVEYSDDESTWYPLGSQAATDQKFRWNNDSGLTEHGSFTSRLTCREDDDKVHENACSDYDDVANSHTELVICVEGYNPTYNTTYYFRLKIDGVYLDLESPPDSHPQVQIETGPVAGEDDIIKKINRNINGNINNGLN